MTHQNNFMDPLFLSHSLSCIYIPQKRDTEGATVPPYHPCLIVQDSQTDVTKVKPCGCVDAYCVRNAPDWIPRAK